MSKVDKGQLYKNLTEAYNKAYPNKSKQQRQNDVNNIWKVVKDNPNLFGAEVKKLKLIQAKSKLTLDKFWINACEKSNNKENSELSSNASAQQTPNINEVSSIDCVTTSSSNSCDEPAPSIIDSVVGCSKEFNKPVQEKLSDDIAVLNSEIATLNMRKNSGLFTTEMENELKKKLKTVEVLQKRAKVRNKEMFRQRDARRKRKMQMNKVFEDHPDLKKKIRVRDVPNRPRLEVDQPLLLQTITELALHGSAAHERRRADIIRTVCTLDDLTEKLREDDFIISRSATYLRLLPKRSNSTEGKRHVNTVPVELIKASNDLHKEHMGSKFAMATIRHLDELASVLGPTEVVYISQDDKAKIPIGLTAAKSQAPLLMHMEYRVKLPDHDFVMAKQHKLVPSEYRICEIKENGLGDRSAIGYSGPTYIGVRSSKHCSSTALSHGRDMERIYDNPFFQKWTHNRADDNSLIPKPVFICTVDGGPDENPRYEKVIEIAIHHFVKNDLDAVFIACNVGVLLIGLNGKWLL